MVRRYHCLIALYYVAGNVDMDVCEENKVWLLSWATGRLARISPPKHDEQQKGSNRKKGYRKRMVLNLNGFLD